MRHILAILFSMLLISPTHATGGHHSNGKHNKKWCNSGKSNHKYRWVKRHHGDHKSSDPKLKEKLIEIGQEIESFEHTSTAMELAFHKLNRLQAQLGRQAKVEQPTAIVDEDALELIDLLLEIVKRKKCSKRNRFHALKKLHWLHIILTHNREENGGGNPDLAKLVLSGDSPSIFANTVVNQTSLLSLTLNNDGSGEATDLDVSGLASPFMFNSDCGNSLAAGASCQIELSYSPTAISALDTDELIVSYHDGAAIQGLGRTLQGTALADPNSRADLNLNFGDPLELGGFEIGSTNEFDLTLTNGGNGPASNIVYSGLSAPFFFVSTTCNPVILTGESCTVRLAYNPTQESANDEDTFVITYDNNQEVSQETKTLVAIGNAVGVAALSLNFGNPLYLGAFPAGSNNEFQLTLTNSGTATASDIVYSGLVSPWSFVGTTCNPTIGAGDSCTITLSYVPQSSAVLDEDIFEVTYDSGQGQVVTSKILQGSAL